jgi:hypothetical protein
LAIGIVGVRLTGAFWGLESPVPEDKVLAGDLDLFPCGWSWAVTNSLDEERVLGESDLEWVDGGESPNQVSDYWALPGDTLTLSYCVAFHLEGDNLDTSMSVKWSPGAPSQGPTTDATYITGATYKVTWLDPDDGGTVFGPNTGFGAFSLGVLEPSGYDPSTPVKKDFKWEVLVTVEFGGTGWGSASLTPVTLPSFEIAADEKRMGGGFLP